MFHVSISGGLELCLGGLSPQKPHSRGDGTEQTEDKCSTKDDYRLAPGLPTGVYWAGMLGNGVPTPFSLVTFLEYLDFSFKFLRVAPGEA